jgi:hypothetical protein
MTKRPVISRRLLLAGLWFAGLPSAWAQVRRGNDQGIGGTGISRGDDHGIGGTGIVGVIQRFGSIFVNGERIGYKPNVPVRIDGEAASPKALRIGQVARVVAVREANGSLITHRIEAVSEVVGPIETAKAGEMTVLGQKVVWAGLESWRQPGTNVAVFGLRRTDGVIVASLVEKRSGTAARIAGLLERDRDGVRIGGLRMTGVDAALVGQRVQAEGRVAQGVMQVSQARADNFSDLPGADRLSIEAYVRRFGTGLLLGAGYVARDGSRFQTTTGDARVVVNATFDLSRGLVVESVQSVNKFPGASLQGAHGPSGSPGSPHGAGGPNGPGGQPGGPGGQPGLPGGSPGSRPGSSPGPANEPPGLGAPGGSLGGPPGGFGGGGMGGGMGGGGPRR